MSDPKATPLGPTAVNEVVPPATPVTPSSPPSKPVTPPVSPTEEPVRVPMSRLSTIEIHNYGAYRGTFRLELPKGENLLVYGENGTGKSSLFHTLRTFLEAPDMIDELVYELYGLTPEEIQIVEGSAK